MSKKTLTDAVIAAVGPWADAWEELQGVPEEADEEVLAAAEDALQKTASALQTAHEELMAFAPPTVDHPEADYYEVPLGDKKARMCRCKNCGQEMNPRGFKRHYKSPACDAERTKRLG